MGWFESEEETRKKDLAKRLEKQMKDKIANEGLGNIIAPEDYQKVLIEQNKKLEATLDDNGNKITRFISSLVNDLSFITVIMVLIVIFLAIWMSNYITKKIENLLGVLNWDLQSAHDKNTFSDLFDFG